MLKDQAYEQGGEGQPGTGSRAPVLSEEAASRPAVEAGFLKAVLNASHDGVVLSDAAGRFILYNRRMEEITGYSQAEAESPGFLSRLHPDPVAHGRAVSAIQSVLAGEPVGPLEWEMTARDGRLITALVSTEPVSYQGATWLLSTVRDMTAGAARRRLQSVRSEVNALLTRPEADEVIVPQLLRTLCRALDWESACAWELGADGLLTRFACGTQKSGQWNGEHVTIASRKQPLLRRVCASGRAQWPRDPLQDPGVLAGLPAPLHPVQGLCLVPIVCDSQVTGVIQLVSTRSNPPLGEPSEALEALEEVGQRIGELLARHRVERRLRWQERFASRIVEAAADPIVTTDAGGRIESYNPAAEATFGVPALSVIGRRMDAVLTTDSAALYMERLRVADRTRSARAPDVSTLQVEGVDASGRAFPLEVSLGANHVVPATFTSILRDVRPRRRADAVAEESRRMEAVGTLSRGIAHDFNNLLMGILGCCRLASRTAESAIAGHIAEIEIAAHRGAGLVANLLEFSGGSTPVSDTALDLSEAIAGCRAFLLTLSGGHIVHQFELIDRPPAIRASSGNISQIAANLVMNARDAMPDGGRLVVRTGLTAWTGDQAAVLLEVSDDGVGMDEATRARALEPFFSTKDSLRAAGLGLATVHDLVRRLGGRLEIESAPSAGTRVRVTFPVAAPGLADARRDALTPGRAARVNSPG